MLKKRTPNNFGGFMTVYRCRDCLRKFAEKMDFNEAMKKAEFTPKSSPIDYEELKNDKHAFRKFKTLHCLKCKSENIEVVKYS
jgi:hypothetical protein